MGKGRITRPIVVVFAVGLLWPLMTALPASAAPCGDGDLEVFLRDSAEWQWDLNNNGSVSNGLGDAFDGYPVVEVGGALYPSATADSCTHEDGGREIVYPEELLDGLQVSRKTFVPPTGMAFARFLTLLRNDTAAPVTTTYQLSGDLGSDGDTRILATSSGDTTAALGDVWGLSDDSDTGATALNDPRVLQVWAGAAPGAPLSIASIDWSNGDDTPEVSWDVTVPPGATFVFMHLAAQRVAVGAATADAAMLAGSAPDPFVGMSAAELGQLRNWVLPVCRSKTATMLGDASTNTLTGTSGNDVILSGGGNDTVSASGGKDAICAGDGNDKVNAGGGRDVILGQAGNDRMNGGPGTDTCKGGPGKDRAKACEKGKA